MHAVHAKLISSIQTKIMPLRSWVPLALAGWRLRQGGCREGEHSREEPFKFSFCQLALSSKRACLVSVVLYISSENRTKWFQTLQCKHIVIKNVVGRANSFVFTVSTATQPYYLLASSLVPAEQRKLSFQSQTEIHHTRTAALDGTSSVS